MRILQLHNHHATLGGAMEVLAHEAELLDGAGHAVEQYTLPATDDLDLSAVRAGLKAIWNVEACRHIEAQIERFRPDVVHVHTPFPLMSPAVFRTAARAGVPAVTTLHSFRYSCIAGTCVRDNRICEDCVGSRAKLAGLRHRCYHSSVGASAALTLSLGVHRMIGTFSRDVSRYLTLTEFARRLLIRDGFPESKVSVKPNSVPDPGAAASPDNTRPFAVFAGRLLDIKGVRTLLDAWMSFDVAATLKIAGDGPLRPFVEDCARRDGSIEYLGWVSEAEITELFGRAQLVIVPSEWYEGFPLVILRSLSVGTPLVVANLENFAEEVVRHGTGWSFPVGDSGSLAILLRDLFNQPGKLKDARRAARASYLETYSPTANLRSLERVYAEVGRGR